MSTFLRHRVTNRLRRGDVRAAGAVLGRVVGCEIASGAAITAILRARLSDDPSLRSVLRRVVEAWRVGNPWTASHALLALAVLGEHPDYFVDQVEAALHDDSPYAVQSASLISSYFADSTRYARLQQLAAEHPDSPMRLNDYWEFSEAGIRVDDVFDYPLAYAVNELALGFLESGLRSNNLRDGVISVHDAPGGDTWGPDNVFVTLAFRRLGASNPAAVRAAVEASPAYLDLATTYDDTAFVATYRRAILSAALPGESLTSDTFSPPADTSLLDSLPRRPKHTPHGKPTSPPRGVGE